MIDFLKEKVLSGGQLTKKDARQIARIEGPEIFELFAAANRIRFEMKGDGIDLCSIVNAKSGNCPEDCAWCAQSARASAGTKSYPLISNGEALSAAKRARESGARRFCIVTSGRKPNGRELGKIADMVSGVRELGLLPCATLGLLGPEELKLLKQAGLERYHNNIESSKKRFDEICSTHNYADKLRTITAVKEAGLSLCSGGIFGMGEDWEDRIEMAFTLKAVDADSVPLNFLIPVPGTRLGNLMKLGPLEALKIISLYRFVLPMREIRVCGGRPQVLGQFNPFIFMAGADGLLTGDYLTKEGLSPEMDLKMITDYGLKPRA